MHVRTNIDTLIDIATKRIAFIEMLITFQINKYVQSKMNKWIHKKVLKSTYESLSNKFTSGELASIGIPHKLYWHYCYLDGILARVKRMLGMFRSIKFSKSDISLSDSEWHALTSDIKGSIFVY